MQVTDFFPRTQDRASSWHEWTFDERRQCARYRQKRKQLAAHICRHTKNFETYRVRWAVGGHLIPNHTACATSAIAACDGRGEFGQAERDSGMKANTDFRNEAEQFQADTGIAFGFTGMISTD
jgi:hypothetical protein